MRIAAEFTGNIMSIRAVEDCIRATNKYKEYLGTMAKRHPVQGGDFHSDLFCKRYEVYPEMEVGWDMSIVDAIFWLGSGTPAVDVVFKYDYRRNNGHGQSLDRAWLVVRNGRDAVMLLADCIPGFSDALAKAVTSVNHKTIQA